MAPDSSKAGYVTLLGRKRSSTARRESEFRDLQETRETAVVAEGEFTLEEQGDAVLEGERAHVGHGVTGSSKAWAMPVCSSLGAWSSPFWRMERTDLYEMAPIRSACAHVASRHKAEYFSPRRISPRQSR